MRSVVAAGFAALLGLLASSLGTAQAEEAARAADKPQTGERTAATPAQKSATKPAAAVRNRGSQSSTPYVAQATPPGRWRGVSGAGQLGAQTGPAGIDPTVRNAVLGDGSTHSTAVGGQPPSATEPLAGGASPVISVRDGGGVVGFSYKIKPQ